MMKYIFDEFYHIKLFVFEESLKLFCDAYKLSFEQRCWTKRFQIMEKDDLTLHSYDCTEFEYKQIGFLFNVIFTLLLCRNSDYAYRN